MSEMTPERLADIDRWISQNQGREATMGAPPFGSMRWTWEAVADLRAEVKRLTAQREWWRVRCDALADDLRNAADNGYDGPSTARLLSVDHAEAQAALDAEGRQT